MAISGSVLTLSACTTVQKTLNTLHLENQNSPSASEPSADHPNWYQQLQTNNATWQKSFTQQSLNPNKLHYYSQSKIQTRAFSNIVINGDYQVQILGGQKQNSITLYGGWNQLRQLTININHNTLKLSNIDNKTKPILVRISAPEINRITLNGSGIVVAKNLLGTQVTLTNNGHGNLLADGAASISKVNLTGKGNIAVLGASGKQISVTNTGSGDIHMQGKYDVRTLTDNGPGNINLTGLQSNALNINSAGSGNIIASGYANLETLTHSGSGNVYFYWTTSSTPKIMATGSGTIGLAGNANKTTAIIGGTVIFDGRFLRTKELNIKTKDNARAKVIALEQLLATATDESQIHYYNQPKHLLKYHSGSGVILDLSHENLPKWCAPAKKEDGYTG